MIVRVDDTLVSRSLGKPRDFDVARDGSWVGLFERADGQVVARSSGELVRLPRPIQQPFVRLLSDRAIVVVDGRSAEPDAGAFVISAGGQIGEPFAVGTGIADVVTLRSLIAITYFDKGVFSGVPPGDQGIAFFELDGREYGGYRLMFGPNAVPIGDCFAASRVDPASLAFTAYPDFPLVQVDPLGRRQRTVALPKELHRTAALSVVGDRAYLFGPVGHKGEIVSWRKGEQAVSIGRHLGRLRGLEGGRFLACGEHGFSILAIS